MVGSLLACKSATKELESLECADCTGTKDFLKIMPQQHTNLLRHVVANCENVYAKKIGCIGGGQYLQIMSKVWNAVTPSADNGATLKILTRQFLKNANFKGTNKVRTRTAFTILIVLSCSPDFFLVSFRPCLRWEPQRMCQPECTSIEPCANSHKWTPRYVEWLTQPCSRMPSIEQLQLWWVQSDSFVFETHPFHLHRLQSILN